MNNRLYVGIDVSQKDYKVCILNSDGDELCKRFALKNNSVDSAKLVEKIIGFADKQAVEMIYIGYESTSVYGWHLQYFLADSKELAKYSPSIICFNPTIIEAFKKTLGDLPKNDNIDSFVIAERLRFGRLPESVQTDFRYLALQRLTRHRFHIVEKISSEKSYYLNNLFLKCNCLCQTKVFSDNFGATATSLIDEIGDLDLIADMPIEELAKFLLEKGKNMFKNPAETAAKLQEAIKSSYKLNSKLEDSLNIVLVSSLGIIRSLEKEKKFLEKEIEKQVQVFKNEYTVLKSVKGVGAVYAAGIIAEIAGVKRFSNDNALAKFSGIYWNTYESADFHAEETSLRKRGNKYLRYYLIQATDHVRKYLPEYLDFYSRKFKESKAHQHKRALVLTSRKFIRLVFALLHEGKLYDDKHRQPAL
ncbi:IS110 family transposase ISDha12 [Clostridia bacterium]|nr:IS110 family transposase ISDha12 [Clostridia bacterium]